MPDSAGTTIIAITDAPEQPLADALSTFEAQFTYPLGLGRSFCITHGDDYPRFFRAIGDARVFVAMRGSIVVGVIGIALRQLVHPDGRRQRVAYIGDLKVASSLRSSGVYLRLVTEAIGWASRQVDAAYGIVMDGTRATPSQYTGRLGIPTFAQVGAIAVLRVPTSGADPAVNVQQWLSTADDTGIAATALMAGHYHGQGGDPTLRSTSSPAWLLHPDRIACGRLEDTRQAKRLISDGAEMHSAHLSAFAYQTPSAAVALIHAARTLALTRGFPAMFVAVPDSDAAAVGTLLEPLSVVVARATIYGTGLPRVAPWYVDTSEI